MGCQPALARTDPDFSSELRKSCDMNGLYCDIDVDIWGIAVDNCPAPPPPFVQAGPAPNDATPGPSAGLAQASQASAATSPIELASRSVSSIEGMDFV